MTGHEFAREVAIALGVEPLSEGEADALLATAGMAAHSSERLAAPLCTYLGGRSGRDVEEIRAAVKLVADRAAEETD